MHRDAVRSIAPSKAKKGGLDVSLTIEVDIRVEVAARSVTFQNVAGSGQLAFGAEAVDSASDAFTVHVCGKPITIP